jgi:D-glycero-D-manno-heptose 1,7-bisphosphate phosphatase
MLLDAARRHGIDLPSSYMIGDRWRDIDAGAAAGCSTILIDRGYDERGPARPPDLTAKSLTDAVRYIEARAGCVSTRKSP